MPVHCTRSIKSPGAPVYSKLKTKARTRFRLYRRLQSRHIQPRPVRKPIFRAVVMVHKPLTVAWISDFPVEWLPNLPAQLQTLPRRHPATWQIVLLSEFEKNPNLRLHIILLRGRIKADFSFER